MHLADGTITNQICTITAVGSAVAVAFAAARVRPSRLSRVNLTRAAAGAAVVFGAQMIDVPLFGGVGVHLVGAAFLAALAGPALALISMALILTVQALLLNDGGVAALGANVFNMGVVAVGVSWVFLCMTRASVRGRGGEIAGVALASVASVMAAVAVMSFELALSGASVRETFALAMTAHAPFAAWETVVTPLLVAVVLYARTRSAAGVAVRGTGRS